MTANNLLELPGIREIHFIGIGGTSMSGLADIMLSLGYKITGSDQNSTSTTQRLANKGITVYKGHSEDNIKNPDMVVYTVAIKDDNPELVKARSMDIPVIDRAQLLGLIMKKYNYSIAISGTHGKTTTTSMVSMILLEAGVNPTIHIGGELNTIGGNTRIGADKYFVTEACEYFESFLKFNPFAAVVLNIELEHLDYFKSLDHVMEAFKKFVSLVPPEGYIIVCADDQNAVSLLDQVECNKITFGLKSKAADWQASNISFDELGFPSFDLIYKNTLLDRITLSVPGIHNVSNALAAAAVCQAVGSSIDAIKRGLLLFTGTNRRFQLKGIQNGIKVIDDYAHHPTEVRATLKAAKNGDFRKIWCVFQPHTYTRTRLFLNDFSGSFQDADTVYVTDIYAAREPDLGEIHSSALAKKLQQNGKDAQYYSSFDAVVEELKLKALPGDLIITMGAGDVYKVGEMFLKGENSQAAV